MKHQLKKEVTFEDKVYKELDLDFDGLTGRDVREAKKASDRPDKIVPVLAMDTEFAAALAAKAAKVPVELMDFLSAPDYMAVTQATVNFLVVSGFSAEEAGQMKAAANGS